MTEPGKCQPSNAVEFVLYVVLMLASASFVALILATALAANGIRVLAQASDFEEPEPQIASPSYDCTLPELTIHPQRNRPDRQQLRGRFEE